jgi:hypothetical protein
VHLGVPLLLEAEVGEGSGRRTSATARLVAEDDPATVLAEAEGLFVALRPERAADVFAKMDRPVGAWTSSSDG